MEYKVYDADILLQGLIRCFWSLEAPVSNKVEKQRIVPDGCMELIIHYGDLYIQFQEDGQSILQPRSFVFGQITHPLEIEPTGVTGVIAARFEPDGFIPFASIPLSKMENLAIPLQSLFGPAGVELEKAVLKAADNNERKNLVEYFLIKRLQSVHAVQRICKSCVSILMDTPGQVNVSQLAKKLIINRRQLERKFALEVGMSPKQLTKIIRFQQTLKMMALADFDRLTDLAYDFGYYDQAHFIKDFKEFTGMSPKQFYADHLQLSVLFAGSD